MGESIILRPDRALAMVHSKLFFGEMGMSRKTFALLTLAGVALVTSGCSRVKGYQGYIADAVLIDGIKAGVDNRSSVEKTLGRPTFTGQFDQSDWYYVSRQTRQYAFASPKPFEQTVLHVRFDAAGNVAAVDRAGVERVVSINPENSKTPTLGKNRGFFEDLFGNIGQVGSVGEGGSTADNPN
jgi:outer membrane protein assembly factor BamE (lipoprotein component of BamABCDE complex)